MKRYQRSRHAECVSFFVLALAISSIAVAQSQSQPPAPGPSKAGQPPQAQPAKGEQPAAPDQRGTEKSPIIVKVLPSPKSQAEATEEARYREEKALTDRWQFYFNGLLVLFTGILAVTTIGLWLATWKAAKAAEAAARVADKTLKITERPHLVLMFEHRDFGPFRDSTIQFDTTNTETPPNITYYLKNFGRQVAILQKISLSADFFEHAPDVNEIRLPAQQVIPPQLTSEFLRRPFAQNWRFEREKISLMKDGKLFFWFAALIEYTDGFGGKYETEVLWRYSMHNQHYFAPWQEGGRNRNT